MGTWLIVVGAVLVAGSVVGAFVTTLAAIRTLNEVSGRADAQIARLLTLSKAESIAEFAAAEKQMHRERMEVARAEAIDGEAPQVATLLKRRSNLGIWSRPRAAPAPTGEKE